MTLYNPELFDLTHRGNSGDLNFYLRLCSDGSRVLEYGCGSGRVTIPLLEQGSPVTGLDNHPGMVALLKKRAAALSPEIQSHLTLVTGSMTNPPMDDAGQFDRIIIPYNGLLCLLTDEQVLQCFEAAARMLRPGGLFAFDIYHVPDELGSIQWDEDSLDQYSFVMTVESGNRSIDVFEKQLPDTGWDRFDVTYLYRSVNEEGVVAEEEYPIPQRCMTVPGVTKLLEKSGFRVREILADFRSAPFDDETTQVAFISEVKELAELP